MTEKWATKPAKLEQVALVPSSSEIIEIPEFYYNKSRKECSKGVIFDGISSLK